MKIFMVRISIIFYEVLVVCSVHKMHIFCKGKEMKMKKEACIKRKCWKMLKINGKIFHKFFMKYWLCVHYIKCIFFVKGRK